MIQLLSSNELFAWLVEKRFFPMSDVAISIEKLSKLYRLGLKEETPDTLTGNLYSWLKAPAKNFKRLRGLTHFDTDENAEDILWALRDVSFEVKRGEVVGIIGRNGAGKSTLLKILSRITDPTTGRVVVNGRVGSLLEVGTGFHPELSGRDNVYMNGTILGMTKADIDRRFDEIVEFSGVEKFLDTPVKRYSSGMKVRLAFAVAAHLDPEILIVDEVLAVGDAEFQAKCFGKMEQVSSHGRTVLLVSHSLPSIANLCSRGILMDKGVVIKDATSSEVIKTYVDGQEFISRTVKIADRIDRSGTGRFRFTNVWLENENSDRTDAFIVGRKSTFVMEYNSDFVENTYIHVAISILTRTGNKLFDLSNRFSGVNLAIRNNGSGNVRCTIEKLPLNAGSYMYHLWARSSSGREDFIMEAGFFSVVADDFFGGGELPSTEWPILVEHLWNQ